MLAREAGGKIESNLSRIPPNSHDCKGSRVREIQMQEDKIFTCSFFRAHSLTILVRFCVITHDLNLVCTMLSNSVIKIV
jgi:hypothetical protein